jgi:predicted benzoate:H+ symporter BenE
MIWMLEGLLGAFAVCFGAWVLIGEMRANALSFRRPESWLAAAVIAIGVWFMWLSWHLFHPDRSVL